MNVALPLALAIVLFFSGMASAHRPLFTGTNATDPESALRISDPSVSHVIYAELTPEAPHRWFVFDNERPREVAIQLGVPSGSPAALDDPMVVLWGPGLPGQPDRLPLTAPLGEDAGAIAIQRTDTPQFFDEPVTGTKSWIVADTHVRLPATGTYYGAVYDRDGEGGKVWVGVGQREGFSWRDLPRLLDWIRNVRHFHEVPGWPGWVSIAASVVFATTLAVLVWGLRRLR